MLSVKLLFELINRDGESPDAHGADGLLATQSLAED